MNILAFTKEIGLSGFLDMLFMALLIYAVLVWLQRTRTGFVLKGIVIMSVAYLVTRQFNMAMTAAVFERFFAVILIALVVIFQEDLRHFFEQIAVFSLKGRLHAKRVPRLSRDEVTVLARTLTDLAKEKIGALVVIRGKDLILRFLDGGIALNGTLSEPLLKSIFDPHSIGHDGAAVIKDNKITEFSAHLPLSKNLSKLRAGGTRHAAALGLSELTDALCIVVSEERGVISVARYGNMTEVNDPEKLTATLESFYEETSPSNQITMWESFVKRNLREKIIAGTLSIGLWFVIVDGAKLTNRTIPVPVSFSGISDDWAAAEVTPSVVEATFQGLRREFYFLTRNRIRVVVKPERLEEGAQRVKISWSNVTYPDNITLENLSPDEVEIRLKEKSGKES